LLRKRVKRGGAITKELLDYKDDHSTMKENSRLIASPYASTGIGRKKQAAHGTLEASCIIVAG
jgi:hypothetical protein